MVVDSIDRRDRGPIVNRVWGRDRTRINVVGGGGTSRQNALVIARVWNYGTRRTTTTAKVR